MKGSNSADQQNTIFIAVHRKVSGVHIFTRDETGLVYLPIQLERTLHFTGDGKCNERGGHAPPPSPAWANFTLMMECMPESSRCYSVYSVDGVMPNWTNWRTMYAMSTKFRFLRSSLCFWIKNMSKRFSCSGSQREKCAMLQYTALHPIKLKNSWRFVGTFFLLFYYILSFYMIIQYQMKNVLCIHVYSTAFVRAIVCTAQRIFRMDKL